MAVAAQPLAQGRRRVVSAPNFEGRKIPCPLCAGTVLECIAHRDRHGGHLLTDVCLGCGHVFTNPQPTQAELDDYYTRAYRTDYKKVAAPKLKHVYRAGLRASERLERLRPYAPPGAAVLDVGAGGGEFVYLLSSRGYRAQGLEPNEGYAAHAAAAYGIDIATGTIEENLPAAAAWDVITLHHVLEHLADPVGVLRALANGLNDQGALIVEVPNVEARYHAPQRRFHFAHLHNFSMNGLHFAASAAGLCVTDQAIQPHTGHLNAVMQKGQPAALPDIAEAAARISASFREESRHSDHMTLRPYRRLWANLKRPMRERLALRKLGSPQTAKDLLDRLYDDARSATAPSK